jgi:hypothetical protein
MELGIFLSCILIVYLLFDISDSQRNIASQLRSINTSLKRLDGTEENGEKPEPTTDELCRDFRQKLDKAQGRRWRGLHEPR